MKLTRRVLAMVLCLVLALSLATTAFAVDISFTGGASGATYTAYQLLNVTDGGDGKFAYTLNSKYTAVLQTVTGKTTEEEIIDYISTLDGDSLNAFSEAVFDAIAAEGLDYDYQTTTDVITGAVPGYYLIAETAEGTHPSGATDPRSLNMLNTLGNESIVITTKESVPTIEKEVQNVNDSTDMTHWGEHADYDVGDKVPFRAKGTVSGKYEGYKTYRYQFVDDMTDGLTMNRDVKIMIGNVDVTDEFVISYTTTTVDGVTYDNGFTAIADLKEVDKDRDDITISHNTEIWIYYSATVNENAVSGQAGNKNEIHLKFETNPYDGYTGDPENPPPPPGETPKDINIVFTFDAIVNKVDKDNNALAGAGFTLYKWINESNSWVQVGTEITGVTTFEFEGLDVGDYKLVETTVPAGYNKAADIEFKIEAIYNTDTDPVTLTGLQVRNSTNDIVSTTVVTLDDPVSVATEQTFTTVLVPGTVNTNVVNLSGSELPSTGGMGTTLFYVFGGVMVLAAVVLLVTKKRMLTAE